MLTTKQINELLNLDIDLLASQSPAYRQWRDIFQVFSHPFRFIAELFRQGLISSRKEGGQLFRVAKYLNEPKPYLAKWPEGTTLDPRLAIRAVQTPDVYDPRRRYQANVEFTVFVPSLGESKSFNIWTKFNRPISPQTLFNRAIGKLEYILSKYGASLTPPEGEAAVIQSRSITSFTYFSLGS